MEAVILDMFCNICNSWVGQNYCEEKLSYRNGKTLGCLQDQEWQDAWMPSGSKSFIEISEFR
jgi:hypothetical protein